MHCGFFSLYDMITSDIFYENYVEIWTIASGTKESGKTR